MAVDEKWKANLEKVAFMKQFPGLLGSWQAMEGKTVKAVIALKSKQGAAAIVFDDENLYGCAADGDGTIRTRRNSGGGACPFGTGASNRLRGVRSPGEER